MLVLYVLALLAHTAFAQQFPCKEGEEIRSQLTTRADDMIGNWSYTYQWDKNNNFNIDIEDDKDHVLTCPNILILPTYPEFIKERREKCDKDNKLFNWDDAKLILTAPFMKLKDSVIFMGEKENWLMVDCQKTIRVEFKKVSKLFLVMINPDMAQLADLLSREPLQSSEIKCLVHNMDVGKGLNGTPLCQ